MIFLNFQDGLLFLKITKIIFLLTFILSGYSYAQNIWNENITVGNYVVEHLCGYGDKNLNQDYSFLDKTDRRVVEKYSIKLQSKYKSFTNYNHYAPGDERVRIQSDLHEINPVWVDFHSKADVEIYLNGQQFDKLIQTDGFFVYYPPSVFDYRWTKNISKKNNANELWFSTGLSSVGLDQYKKGCHNTIESQRVEFERENNKPVNRLKKFFGI